jgi:hypothetical protein
VVTCLQDEWIYRVKFVGLDAAMNVWATKQQLMDAYAFDPEATKTPAAKRKVCLCEFPSSFSQILVFDACLNA